MEGSPPLRVPTKKKSLQPTRGCRLVFLVDPKGIEPSNLTDANRALSQLSYGPIFRSAG